MTHDVKSYIITQHHTSWYESKAVYYEIQGQKTHKGGVARVAEKWTCLLHPCAIQISTLSKNTQHLPPVAAFWNGLYTVLVVSHQRTVTMCLWCSALWVWGLKLKCTLSPICGKSLKNIRLLGAMCQESQVSCQRVSEQPSPLPLPLATDLARNTRWNRNSKAPLAPALFWDSWHIDSSVYTPMLTWLGTIQIMYSLEKLWDAIAIAPISLRHSPLLSVEWFVQELFCEGGLAKQRNAGTLSVERKQTS